MDERNKGALTEEKAPVLQDQTASAEDFSPATAEQAERERLRQVAISANQRAVADSPGIVSGALGERLYSIDEMRQMTSKEVKGRYHSLLASLRRGFTKW